MVDNVRILEKWEPKENMWQKVKICRLYFMYIIYISSAWTKLLTSGLMCTVYSNPESFLWYRSWEEDSFVGYHPPTILPSVTMQEGPGLQSQPVLRSAILNTPCSFQYALKLSNTVKQEFIPTAQAGSGRAMRASKKPFEATPSPWGEHLLHLKLTQRAALSASTQLFPPVGFDTAGFSDLLGSTELRAWHSLCKDSDTK